MAEMLSSQEEKDAALAFEQAKSEANLEYARRIREDDQKEKIGIDRQFDKMGQERVPDVELSDIYRESTITEKSKARRAMDMQPVALFTDVDNTFYHKEMPEKAHKLAEMLDRMKWGIVYVTGRDFDMVINQVDLPRPDVIVGAVGTEIYIRQRDNSYVLDEEYRNMLLGTWDRNKINKNAQDIVQIMPNLKFQPRDIPGAYERGEIKEPPQEFKISFHFFGNVQEVQRTAEEIEEKIPEARIIMSADIHSENKYNIDLLPKIAGKELAVKYLSQKLGIKGLTAGDSGNDLSMLVDSGHPAIIVGGATEEMRTAVIGVQDEPSFNATVKRIPSGHKIMIGHDKTQQASMGLISALQQGDLNPEDAKFFVQILYELSKQEDI